MMTTPLLMTLQKERIMIKVTCRILLTLTLIITAKRTMGLPARVCITFGSSEFMRTPWPAASTMIVKLNRSLLAWLVGH